MKTPTKSALNRFTTESTRKYKLSKGLITSYSQATKKASIQLLGSSGAAISNVPVSVPCQTYAKANMMCIVGFTEENNPASAVLIGLILYMGWKGGAIMFFPALWLSLFILALIFWIIKQ